MDYTADEMVARTSEAEWVSEGYFKAHVRKHWFDWEPQFPHGITPAQYDAIRVAAIRAPQTHIFTFSHEGQPQWGFFCEKLAFEGEVLGNVAVIYDVKRDAITNCHFVDDGINYFRLTKDKVKQVR